MAKGVMNILAADKLLNSPRIYSSVVVAVGACSTAAGSRRPGSAGWCFSSTGAPAVQRGAAELRARIEQVVRLVRSKASASTSSPRTRSTYPTWCSVGSATACSTRCVHSHHAMPRPCARPPRRPFRPNPENQYRAGHHRARHRRSAGVVPRRERSPQPGGTCLDDPAVIAHRAGVPSRA